MSLECVGTKAGGYTAGMWGGAHGDDFDDDASRTPRIVCGG